MLFVQHGVSRVIRKTHSDVLDRMDRAQRDALPRYRENPKYITRGAPGGGEVERWPQVADVVYCGGLVFAECMAEEQRGSTDLMHVRHRDGSEALYALQDLQVVHHNIEGMLQAIIEMPSDIDLDCKLVLGLHERIFGRLFPWGGHYRTSGDIVVGRREFDTPAPQVVPMLMMQFESDLRRIRKQLREEFGPVHPVYWRELVRAGPARLGCVES